MPYECQIVTYLLKANKQFEERERERISVDMGLDDRQDNVD